MWSCGSCSEVNDDNFEVCWKCQTDQDAGKVIPAPRRTSFMMRTKAVVPCGHWVRLTWFQHISAHRSEGPWPVVEDLTAGMMYGPEWAIAVNWRDDPDGTRRVTVPVLNKYHPVAKVVAGTCVSTHVLASDRGSRYVITVDLDDDETGGHGWRRLHAHHPAFLWGDEGLQQQWPNGAVHRIHWSEPYTLDLHRDPTIGTPHVDIHVRVRQRRGGHVYQVQCTLAVTRTKELEELPALTMLLPRIEGAAASEILEILRARSAEGDG